MKHEIKTVYIREETCKTPTDEGFRGEIRQCICGRIWLYDRYVRSTNKHLYWQEMTHNKSWVRYIKKEIKKKNTASLLSGN